MSGCTLARVLRAADIFMDLFEGNHDVGYAIDLAAEIAGSPNGPEYEALISFGGGQVLIEDGKYVDGSAALETLRQKLDAGLTDRLIRKYQDLATAAKDRWTKIPTHHSGRTHHGNRREAQRS